MRTRLAFKLGWESPAKTRYFMEFPDDLGLCKTCTPASPWQVQELKDFSKSSGGTCCAHHTCQWAISVLKPERTLSNLEGHQAIGVKGWPAFNQEGKYTGPLPSICPHGGHEAVVGRSSNGIFETKQLATFARPFNQYIAALLVNSAVLKRIGSLFEAEKMISEPIKELAEGTEEAEATLPPSAYSRHGFGPPLFTSRRGRRTPFHDGAGLCSPGRGPPPRRITTSWAGGPVLRSKLLTVL